MAARAVLWSPVEFDVEYDLPLRRDLVFHPRLDDAGRVRVKHMFLGGREMDTVEQTPLQDNDPAPGSRLCPVSPEQARRHGLFGEHRCRMLELQVGWKRLHESGGLW